MYNLIAQYFNQNNCVLLFNKIIDMFPLLIQTFTEHMDGYLLYYI